MLVTRQKEIPFSWLLMIAVPWVFFYFIIAMGGLNFFILNRLIENPITLTFLMSLPGVIFTFIPLGSYVTFMSDRIWTKWGRRKIFLIIYFSGMATIYFFYPLAPNIFIFITIMFIASIVGIFGGPFESLKLEIVPPYMRGRSGAINQWISTGINIVFWGAVLGRFDEVLPILGKQVAGVNIIYWCASGGALILVYIYMFGIKEIKPKSTITGEKFNFKKLWQALTIPQLRYLYVFVIATSMLGTGLGVFGQLLYINQWGFSLQEMGTNVAIGGILNLFIIPLVGVFADKARRYRMHIWLACLIAVQILSLASYLYYTFYLPDQRPSLVEIIFFGETSCIFGILAGMMYYPLVYDYVPRNLMGTYMAGSGIIGSLVNFTTSIGIGGFMWLWATVFYPPAGEMVHVCFAKQMNQHHVEQLVQNAGLVTPEGKKASLHDITARAWYANGIVSKEGTAFEIRLGDQDSEKKRKQKDKIKNQCDMLEAKIREQKKKNFNPKAIANLEDKFQTKKALYNRLDSTLIKRAELWSNEVVRGLGDYIIKDRAEVLSQTPTKAAIVNMPISYKAMASKIDKISKKLQSQDPSILDLTMINQGRNFALSVSAILPEGQNPDIAMISVCKQVTALTDSAIPDLLVKNLPPVAVTVKPAMILDLALVENPIRTFQSVITRGVNKVLSLFVELPPPDQKVVSLGRNITRGTLISHAHTKSMSERNGLHLTVVRGDETMDDATWLDSSLTKIRTECASLRLTLPTPIVDKGVVPIRYNYLAGNIYLLTLVTIGFLLVMFFISKEKAGIVRKWGAEEAEHEENNSEKQKEKKIETTSTIRPAESKAPSAVKQTYTPGFLTAKIIGLLISIGLLGFGIHEGWPNLRLLLTGERTQAIAYSVISQKTGQADILLQNQAELDVNTKAISTAKDYTWTYYNVFAFTSKDGNEITFTRNVGCKLKPSMPLLDDDGLPKTATILYDRKDPTNAMLPFEYSTWLAPVIISILALVMFLVCVAFVITARKPIELHPTEDINLEKSEDEKVTENDKEVVLTH